MDFSLRPIDLDILPPFLPYLLPQAAQALRQQLEGFAAIGAVSGVHSCAAIAGIMREDELNIFSLYVDKNVRGSGIGTALYNELVRVMEPAGVCADWILPETELAAAESFFLNKGFSPAESGDEIYRLSSSELRKAPSLRSAFSPAYRQDGNIVPVSEFTDAEISELLSDESIPAFLRLDSLPGEELLSPACLGYRYGGRICAYLLCSFSGGNGVALRAALSRDNAPPAAFHLLAAAAIKQTLIYLGGDFSVFISPVTAPAKRLTEQLSGGKYEIWRSGSCVKEL